MIDQLAAEVEWRAPVKGPGAWMGFNRFSLGTKLAGVWNELSGCGEDASSKEGYHKKTSQGSAMPRAPRGYLYQGLIHRYSSIL